MLSLPPVRTGYYGTNSVHSRGSLIWKNLPSYLKSNGSTCEFKNNKEFHRYSLRLFNMNIAV